MADIDEEEPIEKRFEDLCQILCIEGNVREEAWDKYKDVWANFSIDGDQLHWLVCALYEACRRSSSDSMTDHVVDNAYVSLSRLLITAKMSMVQFFHRIKNWADMTEMQKEMRYRVERLERQFAVASVIFKSFATGFYRIFKYESPQEVEEIQDNISTLEIFKFIWLIFMKARANFPAVIDDLVNSYYLLCCCLDWTLGGIIVSGMTNTLNLDFWGLPKELVAMVAEGKIYRPNVDQPPCILRPICEDNEVNFIECKTVKEHFFKPFINRLVEKDFPKLRHQQGFQTMFIPENFHKIFIALTNNYEEYVIGTGDFDERIFLNPNASEEIGSLTEGVENVFITPLNYHKYNNEQMPGLTDENKVYCKQLQGIITRLNGGVNILKKEDPCKNNLIELKAMIVGKTEHPSESLAELLETHSPDFPLNEIQDKIDILTNQFALHYDHDSNEDQEAGQNIKMSLACRQRVNLAHTLYWISLENTLNAEIQLLERQYSRLEGTEETEKPRKFELSNLLIQDSMHRALFSLSLEVVLLCCDPDKQFPWICQTMEIDALEFYKVVEIFVKNVDLPRDIVLYLNQLVELIISSYVWRESSPIWSYLLNIGNRAPSIEEVTPQAKLEYMSGESKRNQSLTMTSSHNRSSLIMSSPAKQPRLIDPSMSIAKRQVAPTSMVSNLVDDESARAAAQLAMDTDDVPVNATPMVASGQSTSSLLCSSVSDQHEGQDVATNSSMEIKMNKSDYEMNDETVKQHATGQSGPINPRHDSMAIFFRHFYTLSCFRLRGICERLNMTPEVVYKTWSLFERCVQYDTELLKDRTLDHILICCLYAMCRMMLHRPLQFTNLLQAARSQAQVCQEMYRRVLLDKVTGLMPGAPGEEPQQYTEEKWADLTRFYNLVFVPRLCEYIREYANIVPGSTGPGILQLAPFVMPSSLSLLAAAMSDKSTGQKKVKQDMENFQQPSKRLLATRNIYVSPSRASLISSKRVTYTVGKSTPKELNELNAMVNSADRRASIANLAMGLKRSSQSGNVSVSMINQNPSDRIVNPAYSTPRTVTLINPKSYGATITKKEEW